MQMRENPGTNGITPGVDTGIGPVMKGVYARSVFAQRQMWRPLVIASGAALFMALFLGYISARYSFSLLVVAIFGSILAWAIVKWPRFGLVVILAFMSTIVAPEFFAFQVNPKWIYYAQEIVLLLILIGSLMYWARNHDDVTIFQRLHLTPESLAVAIFFGVLLAKSLTIMIERHFSLSSANEMYNFNRGLTFYLLFIPVLLILDSQKRLRWMVKVLYILGTIVMIRVLLELLFPQWSIWTDISVSEPLAVETPLVDLAVQRLRAPGGTLELMCFWTGMMSIILQPWTWKRLAFYIPFTLAMLTGMILEFNRSYILPMAGLLLLTTLLNRKYVRMKLLSVLAVAAVAVLILMAVTGTMQKYIEASVMRYGSALSSQSLESQSVESRRIEQTYAFQAISQSPLFGIGLDELYRPPVPGMLDNLRWYIHDSYLWFWTYFGLVGLAAFVSVIVLSILRSVIYWKRVKDPLLQSALLGSAFSLATLLAANFAAPKFYDLAVVPVVAVLLAMSEAIIIWERKRDRGVRDRRVSQEPYRGPGSRERRKSASWFRDRASR